MEENKKEFAVDMDKLIIRTHNLIANWNNKEGLTVEQKTIELKHLAHEIVSDVLTTAFSQLDGARTKERVLPGDKPRSKLGRMFGWR